MCWWLLVVAKQEKKKRVVVFVVVVSSGWWAKRRLKKNKNKQQLQLQQTRTKKLSILLEKNWGPSFLNFYYNLELSALESFEEKEKRFGFKRFGFGADFFGTRIISKCPLKELGNVGGGGGHG
jgi:hypothetical protein